MSVEQAFSAHYRTGDWNPHDPTVKSGEGSVPKRNRRYVKLLTRFLREKRIRSVVDLGCGDWSFSRYIDWTGIDYTGVDVVPEVVEANKVRFSRFGVRFMQANFVADDLPPADLVICKEALQHLPNAMVDQFLARLGQFKYAILTNDCLKFEPRTWRKLWKLIPTPVAPNSDIAAGGWRPLRLRDAPFNLPATLIERILLWHSNGIHVKEVLLWAKS